MYQVDLVRLNEIANVKIILFIVLMILPLSVSAQLTPPTVLNPRCSSYSAPTVPSPLRTFYLNASSGNDSSDGLTPSTAWKTLQKANSTAQAGDLFLLRGTFGVLPGESDGQWINPNSSGTASNKITYRKESGQTAIIETGRFGGALQLGGKSHIVIDGLEIRSVSYPVNLTDSANNIWLRNLYIHNSGQTMLRVASNNRIEDSVFDEIGDPNDNAGDAVILLADPGGNTNGSDNNIIVRNYFGKAGHAAYDDTVQGDSVGFNDNNIVAQNIFNNVWATNLVVGGRGNGTLIECNEIKNASQNTPNPTLVYPRPGIQYSGDNGIIRYNTIYNNKSYGIIIQGYTFATTQQQFPENNLIYQNTVAGNGSAGLMIGISDAGYPSGQAFVRNNTFENNIFWSNGGYDGANGQYYDIVNESYSANTPWSASFIDGNIFRYNNASNRPFFLIVRNSANGGNLYYDTPSIAQATFTQWTNNRRDNPLFVNASAGNYNLQASSPMIDQGRLIPGVSYNGSAPDLGAYETGGSTAVQSPYPGPSVPNITTTIEVENFDKGGQGIAYNENFGSTSSGAYRSSPVETVDIAANSNASNGYAVFEASAGEWLEYTVNIAEAGLYNFDVRYSSGYAVNNSQANFKLEVCEPTSSGGVTNCVSTPAITLYSTSGWSNYETIKAPLYLPSTGTRVLRLLMVSNAYGDNGCSCVVANFDSITASKKRVLFDFDNDRKSDISAFRPSNGDWYIQQSTNGFASIHWGLSSDIITPADFDGDGKTDVAVWRPSDQYWYIFNSSTNTYNTIQLGVSTDIPVQADYDGDGKADVAVFRPSTGGWYRINSSNNTSYSETFGSNGDKPAVGDYDGDGKSDVAIYRPSTGGWWINRSRAGLAVVTFGVSTDKIVPADYTGDGKTDIAVWRPSTGEWFVVRSEDPSSYYGYVFGANGDVPVPADYDGDGKTDTSVFRPTGAVWHLLRSTSGYTSTAFGLNGDIGIPSTYVR